MEMGLGGEAKRTTTLSQGPRSAEERPRLTDVLFENRDLSFASVALLPSNMEAIDSALQFVAGQNSQVAILGPSGAGKSQILQAVRSVSARTLGLEIDVISAESYLGSRRSLDTTDILVLDDAQVALGRVRMRQDLRRVLEARARRGKPTLVAFTIDPGPMGALGTRAVQNLLPSPRSWAISTMREPARDERPVLLAHVARAEGLRLSSALSTVLSRELGGNGHTLVGAMRRLRLEGSDWSTSRQTLRGLGLLDPFFSDNSSWDLRHRIYREADRHRIRFAQFALMELAVYTMLHEARLCERSVAQYVGKEPAEVYGLAARFSRTISDEGTGREQVDEFVDLIVASLVR